MAQAWLVLAAGDDRQHGGNDGYADTPTESYSWDDTVPNHGSISIGDAIVVWDKHALIGASVVEDIERDEATKTVYRCPECGGSNLKRRRTLDPPWRCFRCSVNFAEPVTQSKHVHTYASRHAAAWVDLEGILTGSQLRSLCVSPRSQLSLRTLRWDDFRAAVESVTSDAALEIVDFRASRINGGHRNATVRVRRGQTQFRSRLLARLGPACAMTGNAPVSVLEAAHLYSYAEAGEHYEHGGLLLRRDIHRLFDLGHIAVNPDSLKIDLDPDLAHYPSYVALHGQPLSVALTDAQRQWIAQHWTQHRDDRTVPTGDAIS